MYQAATTVSDSTPVEDERRNTAPGAHLKDEGTRLQVVMAGATAGLFSRFVVAPLDVIKIRLQLQPYALSDPYSALRDAPAYRGTFATLRHIIQYEGLTGLWKGNVPAEIMYVCYASIQFTAYRTTTMFLQSALPRRLPDSAETFVAGATSGAAATLVTYPLDLLRTRFAAQGTSRIYSSLFGAVRDIHHLEGPRGFFRGIGPTLGQIVPFMGTFFMTYEALRSRLSGLDLPWGSGNATAGVLGGVVAKTVVFPLDLVRKRIQVQGPTRNRYVYKDIPEYASTARAISTIVRAEGWRGLYKGLPISLLKAAPAGAFTVWTYERALRYMVGFEEKRDARL